MTNGSIVVILQIEFPVPDDVTKRKTKLELDPAGDRMHLSFDSRSEFEPIEGNFKGLISPLDSVWMLGELAVPSDNDSTVFGTLLEP